jgi:hypothetical protein
MFFDAASSRCFPDDVSPQGFWMFPVDVPRSQDPRLMLCREFPGLDSRATDGFEVILSCLAEAPDVTTRSLGSIQPTATCRFEGRLSLP